MMTVTVSAPASRTRGRPREFDVDDALDKAIVVFRERGYNATSIADLGAAMGLSSGSIYKAFTDKRGVFEAAFARSQQVRHGQIQAALRQGRNGREKLVRALEFYADDSCGVEGLRGCLVVGATTDLATFDPAIGQQVKDASKRLEKLLLGVINEGQADGSIAASVDPKISASLMYCLLQGMRVMGKHGRSRKDMLAVVAAAMKCLD